MRSRTPTADRCLRGLTLGSPPVARAEAALAAPLRLMAVHAHPDDESSKGAASLAKYSAEGVGVVVVSCTGGERGDVLNPKLTVDGVDVPALRISEMARAAEILGRRARVARVSRLRVPRGCRRRAGSCRRAASARWTPTQEIAALVKVVRQFRPHVMTTYDENGGYPHPDHIRCHVVSVGAFEAAGDPEAYPDAGEPWQPLKLYYNVGFSRERILAINNAVKERTGEGPFDEWIQRFADNPRPDPASRITTRVPVADYFDCPRRCAARRTRPRSTRIRTGSPFRTTWRRRSGAPTTTNWPGRWSTPRCRRTTCSRGSGSG